MACNHVLPASNALAVLSSPTEDIVEQGDVLSHALPTLTAQGLRADAKANSSSAVDSASLLCMKWSLPPCFQPGPVRWLRAIAHIRYYVLSISATPSLTLSSLALSPSHAQGAWS